MPTRLQSQKASTQSQKEYNKEERERLGLDGANPNDPYYGAMEVTEEYKAAQNEALKRQAFQNQAFQQPPYFSEHMPPVAYHPIETPIDLYPPKYSMSTNSTPTRRENVRMNGPIGGPLSPLPGEGGKKRRKTMKRKAMKGKTMKRKAMKRKTMKRKTRRKINKKK